MAIALLNRMGTTVMAQTPTPEHAPRPEPAPAITASADMHYPAPEPPRDPDALGRGVQRTMTLLATSTPQRHNHVRILFYGQSITEQDWTKRVVADLKRRFPNADIEAENRAIGGFASQMLVRPAEHDLYPFYPDLLIFHVYGADNTYEEIIRNVRSRTAAEVLMQKDHATFWPTPQMDRTVDKGKWWDDYMNNVFLPRTAARYGCGLDDIRSGWVDYLKANQLEPRQLTIDGTHLNDQGNFLMARLIERYLDYRPELHDEDWRALSTDIPVNPDTPWKNGRLEQAFDGNRIDLLPSPHPAGAAPSAGVRILIDGQPPSAFPGAYAITRPQPNPWASPLALARVEHDAPLILENWTLTVTSAAPDSSTWTYDVAGSVTGPDGSGDSAHPFLSHSGRVRITPTDFFRGFAKDAVPVGHTITWTVVPLFQDVYGAPEKVDPTRDQATTVVQGIPNGQHTLTLIVTRGGPHGASPVRAIRVYRPSLSETPADGAPG